MVNPLAMPQTAMPPKQMQPMPQYPVAEAPAPRKVIEEPMTEMKRVPYRIEQRDETDMFEHFSCSSDFHDLN